MGNKRIPGRWLFLLAAVFLFAACDVPLATLNELYEYPREMWGEWIRIDTGDLWRFGGNWRATGNTVGDDAVIEMQSEHVIKITQTGETDIYLFASRLPTASFSGRVAELGSPALSVSGGRAIGGLGGLPVQISNVNDRINSVTVQTDDEGIYTANNIVIEDEYEVTVEGETTKVTINTDGDDVGTITIVEGGENFKTTLERRDGSADQDMTCLWRDVTYYFNIVIENTGNKRCLAPAYELFPGPGISLPNTKLSGQLTTIEPGASRKIPVEIVCFLVGGESENKKIDIAIVSALDRRSWDDSVSLKFNHDYVYLNIRSDADIDSLKTVSGIIIVPGVKAYSFSVAQSSSRPYDDKGPYKTGVPVPKYDGKDYLVVFSGASADSETFYSFNISGSKDGYQDAPDLSGFGDVTAGEDGPDGSDDFGYSEDTAVRIDDPNAGFKAYLHTDEVEFYRFSF
jgi:hypothetical protein